MRNESQAGLPPPVRASHLQQPSSWFIARWSKTWIKEPMLR
jgi:hypothetical protein